MQADAAVIVPARLGSSRLPGKPLLAETGRPLVVHVADRAAEARRASQVVVATDDPRIVEAVEAHGHRAVMTRADHANGTSRVHEAAERIGGDAPIIVNVQGDEPEIDPALIDTLIDRLAEGEESMATVVAPFAEGEDVGDPNVVKAVLDQRGRAMYFSRSVVPHRRDADAAPPRYMKHLGIYAYRRAFLPVYVALAPTPAETAEQLEQLRALEHGHAIAAVETARAHPGIDTPDQYAAFVERWRRAR